MIGSAIEGGGLYTIEACPTPTNNNNEPEALYNFSLAYDGVML